MLEDFYCKTENKSAKPHDGAFFNHRSFGDILGEDKEVARVVRAVPKNYVSV